MAKITIAKPMGAIFASTLTSEVVSTSNYQKLTFAVFNDADDDNTEELTVTAKGVDDAGTATAVKVTYKGTKYSSKKVTLDGTPEFFEVDVHQGYAKYEITAAAITDSETNGMVLAIQENPVHSEL